MSSSSRGGSREQHVKAGEQSHKDTDSEKSSSESSRGGTHEQHVRAGEQSHKNTDFPEVGVGRLAGRDTRAAR